MGTRALVIGLDGAEWSVIRRLQNDGLLPNLSRLIREGAHGPLNSTTPPMTLPSWSSMLTGCHPVLTVSSTLSIAIPNRGTGG